MPPAPAAPQWPPRSPHEALIATPGGRDRLRRLAQRTSPSPSPLKTSRSMSALSSRRQQEEENEDEEEEDEDEETLQLRLEAIQARLKLKKLQNAKARRSPTASTVDDDPFRPGSAPLARGRKPLHPVEPSERREARPRSQNEIEVPASPVHKPAPLHPQLQASPTRVLLGIDKGLKAKDISLKRAPSVRAAQAAKQSGHLQRSSRPPNPNPAAAEGAARPLSFNERLASARTEESGRLERRERIQRVRTNAFGIGKAEMDELKQKAVDIPDEPIAPPREFTRDEIMSRGARAEGGLKRSNTTGSLFPTGRRVDPDADSSQASFEAYSGQHLSRRIVPHQVLARQIAGKKVLNLQDVYRSVKSPDFQLPEVEQDLVVFAILARKSDPRSHKGEAQRTRGKFMVLTLVDLKLELELFLFNSGFDRFWKLTEGTLLAILNPSVMPPPRGQEATGRFSLVINSDVDQIIEVGTARDLGYCRSVKADGKQCGSWVNAKRTEFCEFHVNEAVKRQQKDRLEISHMSYGNGGNEFQRKKHRKAKPPDKVKDPARKFDYETRSSFYAAESMGAAELLDGVDSAAADRKERQEGLRRRMADREREMDLAKKLGRLGSAAGREYMLKAESNHSRLNSSVSSAHTASSQASSDPSQQGPTAHSLGLVAGKGQKAPAISLSPVNKRKRTGSSQATTAGSGAEVKAGFGWGGNLKDKLSRMKDGEHLSSLGRSGGAGGGDGDGPPAASAERPPRKKTRFVTEKGIREAGRESLGADLKSAGGGRGEISLDDGDDDDDDDELVIVR